jgi:hypothetical protein
MEDDIRTEIRDMRAEIKELSVKVATRDDLKEYATKNTIDSTKEFINLKIEKLQEEIDELRERPINRRGDHMYASAIIATSISALGFIVQHFVWR